MKKILFILCLLFSTLQAQTLNNSINRIDRDFYLSIKPGFTQLTQSETDPLLTIEANYYLFSQHFRMSIGTHLIDVQDKNLPTTALHFMGLEYSIPVLKNNQLFLGIRKYKAYFLENEQQFHKNSKGYGFYCGARKNINKKLDLMLELGSVIQPFQYNSNKTPATLNNTPLYLSVGLNIII